MGMFLKPFSCKQLYIKSHQVGETNKRTVVVVVARVYRQNSSRSINRVAIERIALKKWRKFL
jgi:hypothetical protein